MSTKSDYQQAIDDQISQVKFSGVAQLNKAIAKAVQAYSKHRPRVLINDLAGADSAVIALSALPDWDNDVSSVRQVEYPVDDSRTDKSILANNDWQLYLSPTGWELHLAEKAVSGKNLRVTYTAMHSCDDASCSIPVADEIAVQSLAAANFCRILAAAYAESEDTGIAADSVDHQSKRREYAALAKDFDREYTQATGLVPGKPGPVAAVVDFDVNVTGIDRLTHPRRNR